MSTGPGNYAAASPAPAREDSRLHSSFARPVSALIYAEFLLTGVVTTFLGPLLPALSHRLSISTADAGTLFVAQFSGSSLGAVVSNVNLRCSLLMGLFLISVGTATVGIGTLLSTHISVFIFGVGLGLVIPATNMLVAKASSAGRGSRLNVLNFVWGAGAAISPIFIAAGLRWLGLSRSLFLLAGIGACLLLLILWVGLPAVTTTSNSDSVDSRISMVVPYLWLCAMLFLYIGIENAVGGWISAVARQLGTTDSASALAVFCFWGALLSGRAVAPAILRYLPERNMQYIGLLIGGCGTCLLLFAGNSAMVWAGAAIAGLGLAPVFALTVAVLADQEDQSKQRAGGWIFALGGMGGAALPWLSSRVAAAENSIRSSYIVPLTGIVVLATAYTWFQYKYGTGTLGQTARQVRGSR